MDTIQLAINYDGKSRNRLRHIILTTMQIISLSDSNYTENVIC